MPEAGGEPEKSGEHEWSPVEEPVVGGDEGIEPVRRREVQEAPPLGEHDVPAEEELPGEELGSEGESRGERR